MERRSIPEYETLQKFLPKICKYLSGAPAIITPLARDLNAARIVDFQVANAAAVAAAAPFERASALITAAMGTIESDPGKFETLLEKLSDHDLKKIVEEMKEHCDTLGRSKKDTGKEDSQKEPLDQESSQKGLASDLCSADIIPPATMSAIKASKLTPFDRAHTVMSAAQVSVEQNPMRFDVLVEKLSDQGVPQLAERMHSRCEELGRETEGERSQSEGEESQKSRHRRGISGNRETRIRPLNIKQGMKILVVGHNGGGKSSLINEMLAQKVAPVGRPDDQTGHDPIEEHKCEVENVQVTIYDTRGFGDPRVADKKTMEAIVKIKTVDVVLICHKLYGRVDDATINELRVLFDNMGNDLFDLSVLVFTFGDDYMSRCDPEFGDNGRLTDKSKQEIKEAMEIQQMRMERRLKDAFQEVGISKEVTDRIPSCISCGKRRGNGQQKELPTSENWVDDLWELCEKRCKPDARSFVTSLRKSIIYGGARGIIGGTIAGMELGTVAAPGAGTAVGAVVGGIAGGIAGIVMAMNRPSEGK